jgi:hypothetical protein
MTLTSVADGVWIDTAPVRFLGLRLSANMTVLRLPSGDLFLYSPIALTPERRAAVEALGPVRHLYAPNVYHHLRIGDWQTACPTATLHAPHGLGKKRPDLRIDRQHGTGAIDPAVEEIRIEGFRLEETVLLHRPSRTLLVADLVHNIGRPEHWWTRWYTKAAGFYDRVAVSRVIRALAFHDRQAARRCIADVLARDFDGLVPGHGAPLATGGKAALAAAYA